MTDELEKAQHRTQLLCDARGDTIAGLRETLRLLMIVLALRDFSPYARPMGEPGRPIEADPYVPRPALERRPPGPVPGQRLPRAEEFRVMPVRRRR